MNDIKTDFADNLIYFRKAANLTQLELAEKIHYSDKAISKWERAESLPDVTTLKDIADLFGITLDQLISKRTADNPVPPVVSSTKTKTKRRLIIALLSISLVWLIAITVYSFASMIVPTMESPWQLFILAIPLSILVFFILSCIWFSRKVIFISVSLMVWTLALALVIMIPLPNNWMFFLIPIPIQIIFLLWFTLWHIKDPNEK